tara:strand:+ start:22719 stop:23750 length:1032 start_codon:yes stop_codon:yes gene_type:complete
MSPTGPVKGAIALANALSAWRQVTLVSLKPGSGPSAPLAKNVEQLDFSKVRGFLEKRRALKTLLSERQAAGGVSLISFCLSADFYALMSAKHVRVVSSVRGNLPVNYRMDYGPLGAILGMGHLLALRKADAVVAMTDAMARQVARFTGRAPTIIPNFVDEGPLEPYRSPPSDEPTVVFLGSLTSRKQPLALIDAFAAWRKRSGHGHLHLVGEGPLRPEIEMRVKKLELETSVSVHGYMAEPYKLLARAYLMAVPSLSEGMSRAVLEALYLGVPCLLRDVDGNKEIITPGSNGILFERNEELTSALSAGLQLRSKSGASLLPEFVRQETCARQYLALAEGSRSS